MVVDESDIAHHHRPLRSTSRPYRCACCASVDDPTRPFVALATRGGLVDVGTG